MRCAYCALRATGYGLLSQMRNDEGPMRADSAIPPICMIAISAGPAGNPLRLRWPPARKHPYRPLPGKAAVAADMLSRLPLTHLGHWRGDDFAMHPTHRQESCADFIPRFCDSQKRRFLRIPPRSVLSQWELSDQVTSFALSAE